ncbi:MAG: hypothetical protein HWE16_14070 [Gammaproteobacteria bacterium]|nr:hypothetical protein [Gammaproteobacteria bacterium]
MAEAPTSKVRFIVERTIRFLFLFFTFSYVLSIFVYFLGDTFPLTFGFLIMFGFVLSWVRSFKTPIPTFTAKQVYTLFYCFGGGIIVLGMTLPFFSYSFSAVGNVTEFIYKYFGENIAHIFHYIIYSPYLLTNGAIDHPIVKGVLFGIVILSYLFIIKKYSKGKLSAEDIADVKRVAREASAPLRAEKIPELKWKKFD